MITGRTAGAAAALLLIACSYWGIYQHGRGIERADWEARWAERDAADSNAVAKAQTAARAEEQRRAKAQEEARTHAYEKQQVAAAEAADADAAGRRLQYDAALLAATVSCPSPDPAAVARGASAARAAMVLSDLLSRADRRAGELAKAYDRARIAGQQCEQEHDALTVSPP